MDAFNFKTNFIGKDGFVWWIGQVAPEDSWIKNFDEYSEIDTDVNDLDKPKVKSREIIIPTGFSSIKDYLVYKLKTLT